MSAPTQVRARHILKKHSGSRRPSSWRCPTVTQSKEEAIAQIQEITNTLKSYSSFDEMHAQFQSIAEVLLVYCKIK